MFQDESWPGIVIRKIPKLCGVGVFSTKGFAAGAVIVRYAGDTISFTEGQRRDKLRTQV